MAKAKADKTLQGVIDTELPKFLKRYLDEFFSEYVWDSNCIGEIMEKEIAAALKGANVQGVIKKAVGEVLADDKFLTKTAKELVVNSVVNRRY